MVLSGVVYKVISTLAGKGFRSHAFDNDELQNKLLHSVFCRMLKNVHFGFDFMCLHGIFGRGLLYLQIWNA